MRPSPVVKKGCIFAYQVFDVGSEIDLKVAKNILAEQDVSDFVRLKKNPKSILVVEHPVTVHLEPWTLHVAGQEFHVSAFARLWSFGAVSVRMTLPLERDFNLTELCEISQFLSSDLGFHESVLAKVHGLTSLIVPSIEHLNIWSQYEEYLVFNFEEVEGDRDHNIQDLLTNPEFTALILSEKPMTFSKQMEEICFKNVFQYTPDDLTLIHWNSAIVYDQDDVEDIVTIIEFALCVMLEMRFYDYLLDKQLQSLYKKIVVPRQNIFVDPYSELSRAAALQYIDIIELVDRILNSFKITGDYYYASLYRAATKEFQVDAWRKSVDSKLDNLAEVSLLFQGQLNERRNQLMEVVIIILIACEVIPFLYSLFKSVF